MREDHNNFLLLKIKSREQYFPWAAQIVTISKIASQAASILLFEVYCTRLSITVTHGPSYIFQPSGI